MSAQTDKVVHWLLSSLEPKSQLFHVGQYCGDWQASTAGRAKASFHVILHGSAWLHFADGRDSIPVAAGEAVFLLRDVPHGLSPSPVNPQACAVAGGHPLERRGSMQPLDPSVDGSVGLACGFIEFHSTVSRAIVSLFPEYLIVRRGDDAYRGIHGLFDLIRAEGRHGVDAASPLIDKLVELLLFYAVRDAAGHDTVASGLATLMQRTGFGTLVAAIIDAPADAWTTDSMAAFANMSRTAFCKHFSEASGRPPMQFVTMVRMRLAADLLQQGLPISRAGELVGYQSESAFAHAFKRTMGMQPGAWRRERDDASRSAARLH
ncbi:AraC family transcriptional regulator [Burkholderia cenocepacia]|uniref:AraC family transcriptional regulator n=1 Tax=Burkholderia cenocepacia TaxID=95486 RepID=UPI00285D9BB5|nr:AraC family transcriptional regulator [Burkholderia cenocepacia]MDR8028955.1 AraC family transcriptional regulator [Burkholderia cenocepacia]MDR8039345.1 AraC family transcriptional regulator [Burkholderia cenocepacia]